MSRAARLAPVFDGFPYLSVDLGDGVAHVVPLPASASRHELERLALHQVAAWRRPFALVFGIDDALLFDENGGSARAASPPRPPWIVAGRPVGRGVSAADPDLAARLARVEVFSARP